MRKTLSAKPCTTCGAALQHDSGAGAAVLACSFCGSKHQLEVKPAPAARPIGEAAALEGRYDGKSRSARCRGCGARLDVHGQFVASSCPYCGGPELFVEGGDELPLPDAIVPFRLTRDAVRSEFQTWFTQVGPGGPPPKLTGCTAVYLPFWVFTVESESAWSVDVGFNEQQTVRDSDGSTRTVTVTRWQPEEGVFREAARLEPVYGATVDLGRLAEIYACPEKALVAFDVALASGLTIDGTCTGPSAAWEIGERQLMDSLETRLTGTLLGDTYRNFAAKPVFSNVGFRSALLPLYVLRYDHGGRSYRCLVNGINGQSAGGLPAPSVVGAAAVELKHFRADSPMDGLKEAGIAISHQRTSSTVTINGVPMDSTAGDRFEFKLPAPVKLACAFAKENALKKLMKIFTRELQTGDEAFDPLVYVSTQDPESTRRFLGSAEVRSLIAGFVGDGGTVTVLGDRVTVHAVSPGTISLTDSKDVARFVCHVLAFA